MILYFTEVTKGLRVLAGSAKYGNSPEEVRDETLAAEPLERGEKLTVFDFNQQPLLVTENRHGGVVSHAA